MKSKVRKIGNSYGIVLPKEALHAMKVKEGQDVYITEGAENSLRLSAEQAGFEAKMEKAETLISRYRNALRELAK
jgi:putative addiction module antidote